jgi:hypothetical protein
MAIFFAWDADGQLPDIATVCVLDADLPPSVG